MTLWVLLAISLLVSLPRAAAAQEQEDVDETLCVPGRQVACPCLGFDRSSGEPRMGAQVCLGDGRRYSACRCLGSESDFSADQTEYYAEKFIGLYGAFAVSIDNPALAGAIGGTARVNDLWLFNPSIEWNPWASFDTQTFSAGVVSVYGRFVRRFPITKWAALRSGAGLGLSWLLTSLMGAPAGSFGPCLAISLLGLELEFSNGWRFILDPSDIRIPAPSISGVPITFHQYRFTFALEI